MAKKKLSIWANLGIRVEDLVMPYFVIAGRGKREPVKSMPGISRLSVDNLLKDITVLRKLGISKVLLFGVCPPKYKDGLGSYAYSNQGVIPYAVAEIKKQIEKITVFTDVCLCGYTWHGHCGIIRSQARSQKSQFKIDNEKTLEILAKIALAHAKAGADWVAPSAMAKGQVAAIRLALDKNGFSGIKIMGYSAKFASNFYGPFRDAADSRPKFGDRRGYQLDYADRKTALSEITADIKEGADMVMVKPALSYLDIIYEAKQKFSHPLAAYNVSGEYAFVKYGTKQGLWEEDKIVAEITASIKRAGADMIISYHAKDIARWLKAS